MQFTNVLCESKVSLRRDLTTPCPFNSVPSHKTHQLARFTIHKDLIENRPLISHAHAISLKLILREGITNSVTPLTCRESASARRQRITSHCFANYIPPMFQVHWLNVAHSGWCSHISWPSDHLPWKQTSLLAALRLCQSSLRRYWVHSDLVFQWFWGGQDAAEEFEVVWALGDGVLR